jgi:hypothetical protein
VKGEWLDKLLLLLKALRFPFPYGKIEIDIEEGKARRYRVTESGRI